MARDYAEDQDNEKELFTFYVNNPTNCDNYPEEYHKLNFVKSALTLHQLLHDWPSDVDEIKYHLLISLEHLMLSLQHSGVLMFYQPTATKPPYIRDPKQLKNLLNNLSTRIINNTINKYSIHNLEEISEVLQHCDDYYSLVLEIGKFPNLYSIIQRTLEFKLFWPKLKQERDQITIKHPTWKYQLESISVIPFLYKLRENYNTPYSLEGLLSRYTVNHINTVALPLVTMKNYMDQAVCALINKFRKTTNEAADIIAAATGCKTTDFKIHTANSITLLFPTITGLQPPTYQEQWSRFNPAKLIPSIQVNTTQPAKKVKATYASICSKSIKPVNNNSITTNKSSMEIIKITDNHPASQQTNMAVHHKQLPNSNHKMCHHYLTYSTS